MPTFFKLCRNTGIFEFILTRTATSLFGILVFVINALTFSAISICSEVSESQSMTFGCGPLGSMLTKSDFAPPDAEVPFISRLAQATIWGDDR